MKNLFILLFLISTPVLADFNVSSPKNRLNSTLNLLSEASCQFEIYDSFHHPSKSPQEVIIIDADSFNSNGEFTARDSQQNVIKLSLKNEGSKLNIKIEAGERRGSRSYSNISVTTLNGIEIKQTGWLTGFFKMGGTTSVNFVCK